MGDLVIRIIATEYQRTFAHRLYVMIVREYLLSVSVKYAGRDKGRSAHSQGGVP
jgi:hypothetical protein